MPRSLWKFLTSLRLTVVCLALAVLLVFLGTIAQVNEGLWSAQSRWFRSFFIWWGPSGAHWQLPVFPGGYLIGVALVVNLLCAHLKQSLLKRYRWPATIAHHALIFFCVWGATTVMLKAPITGLQIALGVLLLDLFTCASTSLKETETSRRLGLNFTHFGVVALLCGQLASDMLSEENHMSFREGETRAYAEAHRDYELAFTRDLGDGREEVISIPDSLVRKGGEIRHAKLPFTVRVASWWENSEPSFRAPMTTNATPLAANGVAQHFDFHAASEAKGMDEKNFPTAVLELVGPAGSLGTWAVSAWTTDRQTAAAVAQSFSRQMGPEMAAKIGAQLIEPQTVEIGGAKLAMSLRATRVYYPFAVTLLKTTHETYAGTVTAANPQGVPKFFQSRVRVENPAKGEKREVDIYMNNPLRYAGQTFFQYQMGRDDRRAVGTSTLQVVHNPGWFTPYLGCALVAYGMARHFLVHLVGFLKNRRMA